jgi:hypothetical protein
MLQCYFRQSNILSVALTLTFCSLPIPESQFSKTWRRKAILVGKGSSRLSSSRIDEIPVSHLPEMQKSRKINLIRQSHLINLKAPENGYILLLRWCPFKIQYKNLPCLQFRSTNRLSLLSAPLELAGQYL